MKTDKEPFFTLTAEETEIAAKLFIIARFCGQAIFDDGIKNDNVEDSLLGLSIVTNAKDMLTKIKQYQDGKIT